MGNSRNRTISLDAFGQEPAQYHVFDEADHLERLKQGWKQANHVRRQVAAIIGHEACEELMYLYAGRMSKAEFARLTNVDRTTIWRRLERLKRQLRKELNGKRT